MKKSRLNHETDFILNFCLCDNLYLKIMMAALIIALHAFQLHASDTTIDQNKISVVKEAVPIKNVLKEIEKQSKFRFFYNHQQVDVKRIVTVHFKEEPIQNALTEIFRGTPVNFKITGRQILLYTLAVDDPFHSSAEQENAAKADEKIILITVSGKVTDEKGDPLPGVSVLVKGTTSGTTTDMDGVYTISATDNNTVLTFSFIGYASKEVLVGTNTTVNVQLEPDIKMLSEIVVTGYTSEQRKDITGSVSVVKAQDLNSIPSASADQQLQGRAAGVTVTSNGQPGSGSSVRIRGFASFSGSNSPLYIVDGVPTLDISALNPNDIESMNVLKDAGAASIYGSRASNGVIVITTKKGKTGVSKLSYDFYSGFTNPGKGFTSLLNSQEMADLTWLALRNSGQVDANGNPNTTQYGNGPAPVLPDYIVPGGQFATLPNGQPNPAVDPALYTLDLENEIIYQIVEANKGGTDWYDELTDNAPIRNHNLGLSGGSDQAKYFVGLNYFDQDGIVLATYLKRYTMRANTEFTFKDKIRIGENLQVSYRENSHIQNLYESNAIGQTFRIQPIIPVRDIMGNWAGTRAPGTGNGNNPVADQDRSKDNKNTDIRLTGNIYAEIDFLKYFTARTSFGGNFQDGYSYAFGYQTYENGQNGNNNGYSESASRYADWTWSNTVTFNKTFGDHRIKLLGGLESLKLDIGRGLSGSRNSYFLTSPDFWTLSNGASGATNSSYHLTPTTLYSQFGRADYAFRDKYLLSATVRRDGSSRFSKANKYGVFPSVTVAWRISEEPSLSEAAWVSDIKIRAGWGTMGSQLAALPDNQYNLYASGIGSSYYDIGGTSGSGVVQGFRPSRIGNPNAKWETNVTTNVGLDISLFNNQLDVAIDLYQKDTEDLLYTVTFPGIAGAASTPAINVGSMTNKGIDVLATYRKQILSRLKLETTLTFTSYKNEITKLAEGIDYFDAGGTRVGNFVRNQVGHPLSAYYGYKVIGIFQTQAEVDASPTQQQAAPGRFKYQDTNTDGEIDDLDRTFIGNPNPKFTYGLNISATYKNFDLSVFFYGVQGRDLVNYSLWWTDFYPSFQGAKSQAALYGSWKSQEDRGNGTPIAENTATFSTNSTPNSYYIENGSYLRARNIMIGYTLASSLVNKIGLERVRIYAQGVNLFMITDYSGLDPELGGSDVSYGIDSGNYPLTKQYIFGLNLSF